METTATSWWKLDRLRASHNGCDEGSLYLPPLIASMTELRLRKVKGLFRHMHQLRTE